MAETYGNWNNQVVCINVIFICSPSQISVLCAIIFLNTVEYEIPLKHVSPRYILIAMFVFCLKVYIAIYHKAIYYSLGFIC